MNIGSVDESKCHSGPPAANIVVFESGEQKFSRAYAKPPVRPYDQLIAGASINRDLFASNVSLIQHWTPGAPVRRPLRPASTGRTVLVEPRPRLSSLRIAWSSRARAVSALP